MFMPHVFGVVAQIGIVLVTGLILLVLTPLPSHEDHCYAPAGCLPQLEVS